MIGLGARNARLIPERLRTVRLSDGETYIHDFADGSGGGEFWMQSMPKYKGEDGWRAPTMIRTGAYNVMGAPPKCRTAADKRKVQAVQALVKRRLAKTERGT